MKTSLADISRPQRPQSLGGNIRLGLRCSMKLESLSSQYCLSDCGATGQIEWTVVVSSIIYLLILIKIIPGCREPCIWERGTDRAWKEKRTASQLFHITKTSVYTVFLDSVSFIQREQECCGMNLLLWCFPCDQSGGDAAADNVSVVWEIPNSFVWSSDICFLYLVSY